MRTDVAIIVEVSSSSLACLTSTSVAIVGHSADGLLFSNTVLDRLVVTPPTISAKRVYGGQLIDIGQKRPRNRSAPTRTCLYEQVELDGADGVQTDPGRIGRRADHWSGTQCERVVNFVGFVGVVVEQLPERQ